MFERFTEPARRVLFFARYEAAQLGSTSIGTAHLLLGLLREKQGIAHDILSALQMEVLRQDAARAVPFEKKMGTSVEIPFAPDAKQALTATSNEADRLGHGHIGPEHLLLALLHDPATVAGSVLGSHGLTLDSVRTRISGERGQAT